MLLICTLKKEETRNNLEENKLTISRQTRAPEYVVNTSSPKGSEIVGAGNEVAAGLVSGSDIAVISLSRLSVSLSPLVPPSHSLPVKDTPLNNGREQRAKFLRSHVSQNRSDRCTGGPLLGNV